MRRRPHHTAVILVTAATLAFTACGGHGDNPGAENTAVTPAATDAPPAPAPGTAAATTTSAGNVIVDSTTPQKAHRSQ